MRRSNHFVRLAAGIVWLTAAVAPAQERAGEAEIGFQHYILTSGSRRVANAFGLTLGFREFIPNVGVVSVSLAPATSNGRFRTGDTFVELKQFPWLRNYWTFRAGDFRLPGRQIDVPFSNLYYPEITGRGAWVEASHGGRTLGFFYGAETLQAGVRVPLRLQTPQSMAGAYFRQRAGERLVLAARFLSLSNDLEKLRESPYLAVSGTSLQHSRTATLSALYNVAGPLKLYGEAALSESSREGTSTPRRSDSLSSTFGPLIETGPFTFRANYVYQTAAYLPLLGYYLGDRRGPFAEIRVRPFSRLELYGSASDYTNNVARDPQRAAFRTTGESAGASVQLPARFSLNGQWSVIKLATRKFDDDPWDNAISEQLQVTLARPIQRHSLRLAVREFRQQTRVGPQRQRTAEVADTFQYRWFSLGGEVRAQRMAAEQSKMSIFVRGNGQVNLKRFSAYANFETGNDLANRTLFATSAMNTTVLGGAVHMGSGWDLGVEAFRNRLVVEMNEQNVFALQGRGVFVPTLLSSLNQWSLHFRMTKRLQWGKPMPPSISQLDTYATRQNQLKGSVEGYVTSGDPGAIRWVESIPVALDTSLIVLTDANGRFRFVDVGEGAHSVGLALDVLPAEYNPGANREVTVLVKPGRPSRADLNVVAVGYAIHGIVRGPEDVPLESIILRLLPTDRFTTPDRAGKFAFYNVKEGAYDVALAEETLPEYAVMKTAAKASVVVRDTTDIPQVKFEFDIHVPPKPVKQLTIAARVAEFPPAASTPEPREQRIQDAQGPPAPAVTIPPTFAPAVARKPSTNSATQLYRRARELTQSGDFKGAVSLLTSAIQAKPVFSLAYNARGYALLRLSKYKEAVADFTEAIRLNPAYANAYRNRSAARKALGDTSGAGTDLEKANAFR